MCIKSFYIRSMSMSNIHVLVNILSLCITIEYFIVTSTIMINVKMKSRLLLNLCCKMDLTNGILLQMIWLSSHTSWVIYNKVDIWFLVFSFNLVTHITYECAFYTFSFIIFLARHVLFSQIDKSKAFADHSQHYVLSRWTRGTDKHETQCMLR